MGMDCYGSAPSDKCGEYFRANIWAWRPIHEAIALTCMDLLGEELVMEMAFNDGAGPDDQEMCDGMADRLESFLEGVEGQLAIESEIRVDASGRLLSDEEIERMNKEDTFTAFRADMETFRKFIRFLRHCGGFSVC